MNIVKNKLFRNNVLKTVSELYNSPELLGSATPDYLNIMRCLQMLNDPKGVADLMVSQ